MPEFIAPDRARFAIADDGFPVIALEGVSATQVDGWRLLNRMTLVVVDGPGDEGFLIRRLGPDGVDQAPTGWDDAVGLHRAARIELSGARLRADLIDE